MTQDPTIDFPIFPFRSRRGSRRGAVARFSAGKKVAWAAGSRLSPTRSAAQCGMADTDPTPAPQGGKQPTSGFHPMPGCVLFVTGILLFLAFLAWGGYTLYTQNKAVDAFTSPEAISVAAPDPAPETVAALRTKLESFEKALRDGTAPGLTLSSAEIATLFNGFERFKEVRPLIALEKIDDFLRFRVSLPMNTLKPGQRRYLNGTITAKPAANETKGLMLLTEAIDVPGHPVDEGFLKNYKAGGYLDDMMVRNFRDDTQLGPLLRKVTSATLKDGQLVLETSKGPPVPLKD